MLKRTANQLAKRLGYRVVRIRPNEADEIETFERNLPETLNELWASDEFKRRYLSGHRLALYGEVRERAMRENLLGPDAKLIDVGCGPGFFLNELVNQGFQGEFSGCDFSDVAVSCAMKLCPTGTFFVQDIYHEIPGQFDAVFCLETLEHLLRPDLAIKSLARTSQRLVITVPEGRRDTFRGHINFWSKESFEVFVATSLPDAEYSVEEINDQKNLLAVVATAQAAPEATVAAAELKVAE